MIAYLFPILAVILGVILVTVFKHQKKGYIKPLLGFSGAFLLAMTLFELLPEVYHHLDAKRTGLFIMLGILLQVILEFFSKGAEHGHIHIHKHQSQFPWLLFISLCLHSFLEGFPIHEHNDMVYGVLIHKIPIAMLITSFLIQSGFSKKQMILFLTVFSVMTPLGTYISNNTHLNDTILLSIHALVIGIFFHIATIILFETEEAHNHKLSFGKLFAILLGIAIAYII
ncbi:ZIP family metal transporter [Mangrovimonas cancribranchiae]|uniref:ZIP family metal transporter n=1 Tax=Mangrovimonas cancribranchiae TaxID=3080055 RepID=A0AAU6P9S7_9FLAO